MVLGFCASQELVFFCPVTSSSLNLPEAPERSEWSSASIQGIGSGFYIK